MPDSFAMTIQVTAQADAAQLEEMGVFDWPIWTKEISEFPWYYDEAETCYLLAGKVIVTPENGVAVEFQQGDLVTFPAGMACSWKILQAVRKHYRFG
ncbi:MAG: cupin domain-containing protein [Leptolyngbyaceae cyanobacterium]